MSLSGRHDALATGITVVQATARANITGIVATNDATGPVFIQIFDALAADVTLGSTVADMAIKLATTGSQSFDLHGAKFDTGLAWAITTTSTGTVAAPQAWVMTVYV